MKPYYLDYNATCPQLEVVSKVMQEVADQAFGNPSSMHWAGRNARRYLDDARDQIAKYLAVESASVVFTSGATEANNMVIQGVMAQHETGHVVMSAIEHPATLLTVQMMCQRSSGWSVSEVKPDADGKVNAKSLLEACHDDTKLLCLMWVNNETGVIQPVQEVVEACRDRGIAVLVDGVQALGKLDVNLSTLAADYVSFSAHKIGGPRGLGILVQRRGVKLESLMIGGGQERGRRSGTENVAGAAGFAAALGQHDYAQLAALRDSFEEKLLVALPDVHVFGQNHVRAGNTSMFSIPGLEGETLLMQMDLAGFAVASGSACSSGKRDPSHVLMAMGVSDVLAKGSLRISFGFEHDEAVLDRLVQTLLNIRQRLKKMSGR
ncbi:MAG: cysteine desulfurase family protein [Mariprofundaceae bacterium]|nr:cysteine desulfurase family protein [Mariprofundaceae bacterium]